MKNLLVMKRMLILLLTTATFSGCGSETPETDAYGNFEVTEINVSAPLAGKIMYLKPEEGSNVGKGELIGLIDTTQLHLRKKQLEAQQQLILSRKPNIATQIEVLQEQMQNATREHDRFKQLANEGAATSKQVDELQDRISVLQKQIQNARSQMGPVNNEYEMIATQIEQVESQIEDATIEAPMDATVILKLAEASEIVQPGMALLRIAKTDTLTLRAFVSGSQLNKIGLGQQVSVFIDKSRDEMEEYKGTIRWIASQAEFTPKIIQTKEERVDLVYAVKIAVPNPQGTLKIGMPAEVVLDHSRMTMDD